MEKTASKNVTFKQVQDVFDSFLLMKDRDVVRLAIAVVLGNQMRLRRPIWLMLVAPPSSGKTTVLNAFQDMNIFGKSGEKLELIHNISDLTENTFASGFKRPGKETSLLFRIPYGGLMVFKDFTSILSKRAEAKTVIMAQLREIYDGAYVKLVGNGEDIHWQGKVGAIAGVTQAVYEHLESMSVMGDRFMLYQIPQPDRREMLKFKLQQERSGVTEATQMPLAQELVGEYIQHALDNMVHQPIELTEKDEDEIIEVADFCTMVRSGIITDSFSGDIEFVPEPEMPARMFEQMIALASIFVFMKSLDGEENPQLDKDDYRLIYKVAFDSIPIKRRIALRYLAQYSNGVDTAGLAKKIGYPTKVVGGWLEQLTALGISRRKNTVGSMGNTWVLKDDYRNIMLRLEDINVIEDSLSESDISDTDEAERHWNAVSELDADAEYEAQNEGNF